MVREDPKRPGPDYYKHCIKFNWIDALVSNHQETDDGKSLYDTKFNKEDEAALQFLKERMQGNKLLWSILASVASVAYIAAY